MSFLVSIGTAVPQHSMAQTDAADLAVALTAASAGREAAVGALYRRTGVGRRHCVVLSSSTNGSPAQQDFFRPSMTDRDRGPSTAKRMRRYERMASSLAAEASRAALDRWDGAPDDITHLVTATCTGFSAPGFDLALVEELPLRRDVQRTQVGFMGCHGALNALRVARAFCLAEPTAKVLVCAAELCSLHFQYSGEAQTMVSNALFGDGAAAAIVTGAMAGEPCGAWRLARHASMVVPGTADAMSWKIGNHGFEMYLSARAPQLIREHLGTWIDGWLEGCGLRRRDIASWAVHPGGPRILHAASDALALPEGALDASWHVLGAYGNMSSPTVLFIVEELRRRDAELPAVVLGFGPGLTIEAALVV